MRSFISVLLAAQAVGAVTSVSALALFLPELIQADDLRAVYLAGLIGTACGALAVTVHFYRLVRKHRGQRK